MELPCSAPSSSVQHQPPKVYGLAHHVNKHGASHSRNPRSAPAWTLRTYYAGHDCTARPPDSLAIAPDSCGPSPLLVLATELAPLLLNRSALVHDIRVPQRGHDQNREAHVGHQNGHEPAQRRQAVEVLNVASLTVLARARGLPPLQVLQDVAERIRAD